MFCHTMYTLFNFAILQELCAGYSIYFRLPYIDSYRHSVCVHVLVWALCYSTSEIHSCAFIVQNFQAEYLSLLYEPYGRRKYIFGLSYLLRRIIGGKSPIVHLYFLVARSVQLCVSK